LALVAGSTGAQVLAGMSQPPSTAVLVALTSAMLLAGAAGMLSVDAGPSQKIRRVYHGWYTLTKVAFIRASPGGRSPR